MPLVPNTFSFFAGRAFLLAFLWLLSSMPAFAQSAQPQQLDLIDLVKSIGKDHIVYRTDSGDSRKLRVSGVPAAGYTLQTGLAALISGNASFYTTETSRQSVITSSLAYTQYKQVIFPIISEIWTRDDKYHISTDWRYLKYPSLTFGLGSRTSLAGGYLLDYSALRLHQLILRRLGKNIYGGLGWDFDYFWNIKEVDTPAGGRSSFERYDSKSTEWAHGPVFGLLLDTRKNPINPERGAMIKVEDDWHPKAIGNTNSWNAFIVDARKYFAIPARRGNNVLAFWSYIWLTPRGKAPYLLLPNTGGDPSSNTGRGYIQGRYRGPQYYYAEGEFRFRITGNGLFGGVVFANAESVNRSVNQSLDVIAPGYGAGLRIKLNKFSNTNLGLDYGFGIGGSRGLFVNLGEVF